MRIGAVNYLNSKPLVFDLPALAPNATVTYDLPSRLADSLAADRLDVALVPSVEFFRAPRHRIISNACVACRGPVLSVKVQFRVPPNEVRRLALDEGSRTSAVLSQILLAEMHGVRPILESLPIGYGPEATDADAVLLIGDRAIRKSPDPRPLTPDPFLTWDLGEKWCQWTGLPFVFAMWIASGRAISPDLTDILNTARDRGVENFKQIAAREAPLLDIPVPVAETYFRDNLHFELGPREQAGLRRFYELCVKHNLAPSGRETALSNVGTIDSCRADRH
ncbi:MAG TPA: menaquinone biosynthesis protein [Lacipirellulaceae bacterium]|jgi:chorismate dehydratase|nr:menaquinone biosynthesis protein [Lacipirellulaceae bacterium]